MFANKDIKLLVTNTIQAFNSMKITSFFGHS
jgi:hypothetical protein